MLYQPLTINKIQEEIKGFKTFTFKEGHHITYRAGQYLTFIHQTPHEEIRRSYSIVSSPALNEPLAIGIRRIQNGAFSRELVDHAKIGDSLITTGAGGLFTLPDDIENYRQVFFFAAGSGITPIISLLKTALYLHPHLHIILIYSNGSLAKTIYYSQLQNLSLLFANRFQPHFIFSNSADLLVAHLNRDLLTQLVKQYSLASYAQSLFYLCGPEAYMRMCAYSLQEEKVPRQNIRKETFIVNSATPHQNLPPDKRRHSVALFIQEQHYRFDVNYPDSILQSAKKNGVNLPYSCETGRCGNCAAKCISGQVWLSYNEVLTEKDLRGGLTLTCVGHPVNGDVVLKI